MPKTAVFILAACIAFACKNDTSPEPAKRLGDFEHPEFVSILGYEDNAMEPFISRDGAFLFFNNDSGSPTDKDIYYASRVDGATFRFQGAMAAINSPMVDGVPTLDAAGNFYFVSLALYAPPEKNATIFRGSWDGSTVIDVGPLNSLGIDTPLLIYFDVEAASGGNCLYLSKGDFRGSLGFPESADIEIAVNAGSGYHVDPASDALLANVNTQDMLEYAPALSVDGLELFFTRVDLTAMVSKIFMTSRSEAGDAFGPAKAIAAIEGFVEAPALSPDGKSLYYHRKNPITKRFEIYRVTRS